MSLARGPPSIICPGWQCFLGKLDQIVWQSLRLWAGSSGRLAKPPTSLGKKHVSNDS